MARFVDVILPVPLPGTFTYALPPQLQPAAEAGCRIVVPFGTKKTAVGLIVRQHDTPPEGITVKDAIEVVDSSPIIFPQQLSFWQWLSSYYLCHLGEVFKAALPGPLKKSHPLTPPVREGRRLRAALERSEALPLMGERGEGLSGVGLFLPDLSPAQSSALAAIHTQWETRSVCLLHGVTSSGKTEIYIHLIAEAIAEGKQVLYLLPEIVLTTQLTDRLRRVFGDRLGIYHSKYSDRQREDVWRRQLSDCPYDIIVGVRSSIFLPFNRLGLVIVDEEHEVTFKQQEPAPRYHARNAAIMLASRSGARTLLGTATPSFESYFNARTGKYGLVTLTERFGQVSLPEIEVVDVSEQKRKKMMRGIFSPRLLEAIREALQAKEQVILFQNRRGFAPMMECGLCGWVPRCPHCDVSLTYHRRTHRVTCHYCGFSADIPTECPSCGNTHLRQQGFGTERIETEIAEIFPDARVARMDLDTTRTRTAYEGIISDFETEQTDILVGTQMVTKGLDFGRVSLVGILDADTMLLQPDFRAYERAYQMMAQVAGRAGRRQSQGRVILQTRQAALPLIAQVTAGDYDAMYLEQMEERRAFAYPPFVRLIVVYVKHRSSDVADHLIVETTNALRRLFGSRVLGPDEPAIPRISGLFIRKALVKLESQIPTSRAHSMLMDMRTRLLADKTFSSAQIYFDVDPL
ncbi:MAG: primosomal protein N' [Bacteroidaceae bacterium]|nr:primosomal protein N' [Bacteroidaceae bacterium]